MEYHLANNNLKDKTAKKQFLLNNQVNCFLCVGDINQSDGGSFSLLHLSRLLKLDGSKVFNSNVVQDPHSLLLLRDSEIIVKLCDKCFNLSEKCKETYRILEETKLQLKQHLHQIFDVLKDSQNEDDDDERVKTEPGERHKSQLISANLINGLRKELIDKCEKQLRSSLPLVLLKNIRLPQSISIFEPKRKRKKLDKFLQCPYCKYNVVGREHNLTLHLLSFHVKHFFPDLKTPSVTDVQYQRTLTDLLFKEVCQNEGSCPVCEKSFEFSSKLGSVFLKLHLIKIHLPFLIEKIGHLQLEPALEERLSQCNPDGVVCVCGQYLHNSIHTWLHKTHYCYLNDASDGHVGEEGSPPKRFCQAERKEEEVAEITHDFFEEEDIDVKHLLPVEVVETPRIMIPLLGTSSAPSGTSDRGTTEDVVDLQKSDVDMYMQDESEYQTEIKEPIKDAARVKEKAVEIQIGQFEIPSIDQPTTDYEKFIYRCEQCLEGQSPQDIIDHLRSSCKGRMVNGVNQSASTGKLRSDQKVTCLKCDMVLPSIALYSHRSSCLRTMFKRLKNARKGNAKVASSSSHSPTMESNPAPPPLGEDAIVGGSKMETDLAVGTQQFSEDLDVKRVLSVEVVETPRIELSTLGSSAGQEDVEEDASDEEAIEVDESDGMDEEADNDLQSFAPSTGKKRKLHDWDHALRRVGDNIVYKCPYCDCVQSIAVNLTYHVVQHHCEHYFPNAKLDHITDIQFKKIIADILFKDFGTLDCPYCRVRSSYRQVPHLRIHFKSHLVNEHRQRVTEKLKELQSDPQILSRLQKANPSGRICKCGEYLRTAGYETSHLKRFCPLRPVKTTSSLKSSKGSKTTKKLSNLIAAVSFANSSLQPSEKLEARCEQCLEKINMQSIILHLKSFCKGRNLGDGTSSGASTGSLRMDQKVTCLNCDVVLLPTALFGHRSKCQGKGDRRDRKGKRMSLQQIRDIRR